ncbi:MAG TPA: isochorismatase family protein [Candidatus Baltobacteraceae bacterium]|nr:isochorismatase family protein [Candidatus Baltobacteraceae bacterium]
MPLTQLDPVAALVVIDLQKGVTSFPCGPHSSADVIDRSAELARAFRRRNLPVILVNVEGRAPGRVDATFNFNPPADWTELVPELDPQPSDYTVTKYQIGAFYGTALERILRRAHVTQIFLTGISTTAGVEATARAAYDSGYNVVLVEDAMTDLNAENHGHAVESTFPRIGEVTTAAAALEKLALQ